MKLIPPDDLDLAAGMLRAGKLVAFPTDTFFALGAVLTEQAISALYEAKGRMAGNPVPVLLSSADRAGQVAAEFPVPARTLAEAFWPGPLTLVLPARSDVPAIVTAGTGNVGLRVPRHRLAISLIALTGRAVTGTSANISGKPPCKTAGEVLEQVGHVIDAVVDAPCGEHGEPSTVVAFTGVEMKVIRHGAIPESRLREALAAG